MSECCLVSICRTVLFVAFPLAVGPLAAFSGRMEQDEIRALYVAVTGLTAAALIMSAAYRIALWLGAARWKLWLLLPLVMVTATEISFQSFGRLSRQTQDRQSLAGFSICVFLEILLVVNWLRIPRSALSAVEAA